MTSTIGRSPGQLAGHIEHADLRRVRGWASDSAQPGVPVHLDVCDGDVFLIATLADLPRVDLTHAGLGECGFDVTLPQRLSPFVQHSIVVRRTEDAMPLDAPWHMEKLVTEEPAGR